MDFDIFRIHVGGRRCICSGFFGPKTRLGLQKFQAEMEIVPNEPATYDKKTREILKKTVDEYLSSSPNKKNNRSKL